MHVWNCKIFLSYLVKGREGRIMHKLCKLKSRGIKRGKILINLGIRSMIIRWSVNWKLFKNFSCSYLADMKFHLVLFLKRIIESYEMISWKAYENSLKLNINFRSLQRSNDDNEKGEARKYKKLLSLSMCINLHRQCFSHSFHKYCWCWYYF